MTNINLDRSNWQLVTFGEVAIQQKESVDRENTDLTRYIKGEHMGSEDLHIREWGELTDEYLGPAFIRKFEKGDILYGSRRTYLRKVAIADFDGITSNTTYVIKANQKNILSELLPFVMMSEGFTEHSIKNSKGSVNPYINWKDIANYEFLLPPKEQQTQLAELLWAMHDAVEKNIGNLQQIETGKYSFFNNTIRFGMGLNEESITYKSIKHPKSWNVHHLKDLLVSMKNGITESQNTQSKGIKITRIETISDGTIDPNKIGFVASKSSYSNYKLDVGDILFSHINSVAHIGKVALYDKDYDLYHGVNLMRLKFKPSIVRYKFLHYHLKNKPAKYFFERRAKQAVNQASLDQSDIGSLPLAIPELNVQDIILTKMEVFDQSIVNQKAKITSSKTLQKSLINQVF